MRYAYPCLIERDTLKSFSRKWARGLRDHIPRRAAERYPCGWSWPEALEMAQDCLDVALTLVVSGPTTARPLPTSQSACETAK